MIAWRCRGWTAFMAIVAFEDVLGWVAIQRLGEDRYTAPNIPMP